ncbi:hypothetical protein SALBM311S_08693 [Streptomyces alboniger]
MGIRLGSPDLKYNRKGKLVEDNTLWISTDGRLASLDVRLVNKSTDEAQKVDVAADELFRLWQLHKDDVYYDDDGNEEPNRGSLQLAFCDLGVPGPDKEFVFYEALREALTARGMPGSLIRFDQEAKNPQQKARLDKDAREGRIAVLVGSRSGLGTGRNLQKRVIHVMQIDPTWKATPIIQSLGRGKRQGNQNKAPPHRDRHQEVVRPLPVAEGRHQAGVRRGHPRHQRHQPHPGSRRGRRRRTHPRRRDVRRRRGQARAGTAGARRRHARQTAPGPADVARRAIRLRSHRRAGATARPGPQRSHAGGPGRHGAAHRHPEETPSTPTPTDPRPGPPSKRH